MGTVTKWIVAAVVACINLTHAQDVESKNRKQMKRTDLEGTTNMGGIRSTTEYQPCEFRTDKSCTLLAANGLNNIHFDVLILPRQICGTFLRRLLSKIAQWVAPS
jgi:hypothetical protein